MGKQKQILKIIIESFEQIQSLNNESALLFHSHFIRKYFKRSINKSEIIRKILNEVVLSNDEIVSLLRIIFNKEKSI